MERLTENYLGCNQIKDCGNAKCEETCKEVENCDSCPISKAIDKLAEYEQAEEDGLLIRLPCKVGDTAYTFNVIENKVEEINVDTLAFIMFISEFGALGKTVFLTKAEAEQALAKMKGE